MAQFLLVTIGFIICLGLIGGVFFFALRSGLDRSDSSRIDPFPITESKEDKEVVEEKAE